MFNLGKPYIKYINFISTFISFLMEGFPYTYEIVPDCGTSAVTQMKHPRSVNIQNRVKTCSIPKDYFDAMI